MSVRFNYSRTKHIDELHKKIHGNHVRSVFQKYGEQGVKALSEATPVLTGKTAASWYYKVTKVDDGYIVSWHNSNRSGESKNSVPVVVVLRYGHVTRNGGYVAPNDFVSPVVKELFNDIAKNLWSEVKNA